MGGMEENIPNPFCHNDVTSFDLSEFSEPEIVDQKVEVLAGLDPLADKVI